MIPSECNVDYVGSAFSLEWLKVLRGVVGIVLLYVYLLSLSPNVHIGLHLLQSPLPLFSDIAFSDSEWFVHVRYGYTYYSCR